MLIDAHALFSDEHAITGTVVGPNKYDLELTSPTPVNVRVFSVCTVAVTASGSETITFELQHSASEGSGFATFMQTAAIPKATLVAGYYALDMTLPRQGLLRYLQIKYTCSGTLLTGTFTSGLSKA
jgi:hypothetical protein